MKSNPVPAISLAIVRHGQIAYLKAYGFAELHGDTGKIETASLPRMAGVSTRFAMGSVSKEFTAAAILKCWLIVASCRSMTLYRNTCPT
jgi:CubicO group peptidase (beta-lactamase class C family)